MTMDNLIKILATIAVIGIIIYEFERVRLVIQELIQ